MKGQGPRMGSVAEFLPWARAGEVSQSWCSELFWEMVRVQNLNYWGQKTCSAPSQENKCICSLLCPGMPLWMATAGIWLAQTLWETGEQPRARPRARQLFGSEREAVDPVLSSLKPNYLFIFSKFLFWRSHSHFLPFPQGGGKGRQSWGQAGHWPSLPGSAGKA